MIFVSERDCWVCVVVFRICFCFGGGCITDCGAGDPAVNPDTADTADDVEPMMNGEGDTASFRKTPNLFVWSRRTLARNAIFWDCLPEKLAARIAWGTLRSGDFRSIPTAAWTSESSEPLSDMLGVVWGESCAIFYIEWRRKYEGYNACVYCVNLFLTHHRCLARKSTIKTQRNWWTTIYGNDRNRILFHKVLAGIGLWVLITNLLRII